MWMALFAFVAFLPLNLGKLIVQLLPFHYMFHYYIL